MRKNSSFFYRTSPGLSAGSLLFVFLVIVGILGIYFYFRNRNRPPATVSEQPRIERINLLAQPSPSPIASPLPPIVSAEETQRLPRDIIWKKFEDPILQFSMQYPVKWFAYPAEHEDEEAAIYSYVTPHFPGKENLNSHNLVITVLRYTSEEEQALPKLSQEYIVSTQDISIAGVTGQRTEWRYSERSSGVLIVIRRGNYVYHINALPSNSEEMALFNLMIDTFTFSG